MKETNLSKVQPMYIALEKFKLPKPLQPLLCYLTNGCGASNTEKQIPCEIYKWDTALSNAFSSDYLVIKLEKKEVKCFIGTSVGEKILMITTEEASPGN